MAIGHCPAPARRTHLLKPQHLPMNGIALAAGEERDDNSTYKAIALMACSAKEANDAECQGKPLDATKPTCRRAHQRRKPLWTVHLPVTGEGGTSAGPIAPLHSLRGPWVPKDNPSA